MKTMKIELIQLQIFKSKIDEDLTDSLIQNVISHSQDQIEKIKERNKDVETDKTLDPEHKEYIQEGLSEDLDELENIKKLTYKLCATALYQKVELISKRAIGVVNKKIDIKSLHKIEVLTKALENINIDITKISNYQEMDELRCLNNSIKHNGYVNNPLSKYNGWNRGDDFSNLDKEFNRLSVACNKYLNDLLDRLIKYEKNKS